MDWRPLASKRHELTWKSYVLQEYEARSRDAKMRWADANGAKVINLQHDGLVMQPPKGWSAEGTRAALQQAVTAAVGYKHITRWSSVSPKASMA